MTTRMALMWWRKYAGIFQYFPQINKEDAWEPIHLLLIKTKKLELLHSTTKSKFSAKAAKPPAISPASFPGPCTSTLVHTCRVVF